MYLSFTPPLFLNYCLLTLGWVICFRAWGSRPSLYPWFPCSGFSLAGGRLAVVGLWVLGSGCGWPADRRLGLTSSSRFSLLFLFTHILFLFLFIFNIYCNSVCAHVCLCTVYMYMCIYMYM